MELKKGHDYIIHTIYNGSWFGTFIKKNNLEKKFTFRCLGDGQLYEPKFNTIKELEFLK